MPKFCANITMLFTEVPFEDRFSEVKEAGFKFVEYLFPYDYEASDLVDLLESNGLTQVLFNIPAGDWAGGDRGIAGNPNRVDEFREGVDEALKYAKALGVERLNCLVGKENEGVSLTEQWKTMVENIAYAADKLAAAGHTLVLEPINTFDIPGFLLNTTQDALNIVNEVKAKNLKIQYDVYHMQKMEGNLVATIESYLDHIGHIQIADNPGRHQPGTGEINYPFVLNALDRLGYEGYVGMEYIPAPDTKTSLGWVKELGFEL